ncbi:hypothetical protein WM40_14205 [Robbsia andropogonis]|uniref:Uncharacterized protein n=1 Tax=Robbsia andropogonis TaxID=28092 RepID=A0A0F5JZ70_9BURK|nr:hypothetical protein WM40_14205 [Robbsia andropogonis]
MFSSARSSIVEAQRHVLLEWGSASVVIAMIAWSIASASTLRKGFYTHGLRTKADRAWSGLAVVGAKSARRSLGAD